MTYEHLGDDHIAGQGKPFGNFEWSPTATQAPVEAPTGGTMSKAKTVKVGLIGGVALLMLSACASRSDVESLQNRVATLESQFATAQSKVSAAEARASQLEAAAGQCTASCDAAKARADQIIQSMRK